MLKLKNDRGNIVIDDNVIAGIASVVASDCFGIAEMKAKNVTEQIWAFLKQDRKDKDDEQCCAPHDQVGGAVIPEPAPVDIVIAQQADIFVQEKVLQVAAEGCAADQAGQDAPDDSLWNCNDRRDDNHSDQKYRYQGQQRFPQVHGEILDVAQVYFHGSEHCVHKQQQGDARKALAPAPEVGVLIHR